MYKLNYWLVQLNLNLLAQTSVEIWLDLYTRSRTHHKILTYAGHLNDAQSRLSLTLKNRVCMTNKRAYCCMYMHVVIRDTYVYGISVKRKLKKRFR